MRTTTRILPVVAALLLTVGCDSGAEGKAEADVAAGAEIKAEGDVEVQADAEGGVADEAAERAKAVAEGTAAIEVEVKAEMLDLDASVDLIKSGKVKDARELEKRLNDPKSKLAKIDIDGDGIIDFVQVVEVKEGDDIHFELRVVPSTKMDAEYAVTVATIEMRPDKDAGKITVHATYTAVVEHHDVYVYEYAVPATWDGDVVVVVGAPFFGWVYAEHDVYVGVYVHDEWIAVPGVMIHVDVDHGCWPPGHCKRGKYKKHKFKGGHKGHKGKVKIKF